MSKGFFPMFLTMVASIGIYYVWSIKLQRNDTVGTVLAVIAAVLVAAAFTRRKNRK